MDIGRSQIYVNGSKEKNGFVPIMGRVAINGTMVRFSSVASELFVFMVKTPIWGRIVSFFSGNEFPSLKCLVCDSISMGNGGKVNGIEVLSQ